MAGYIAVRASWRGWIPGLVGLALLLSGAGCAAGSADNYEEVGLGRQAYQQNCAVCHGVRGEGQPGWQIKGPDGRYPPPPHDSTGHTWHHSDGLLFRIVKKGGASLNIPGFQSGMPAFEQRLSDEEIRAVINYLKTFWGLRSRSFSPGPALMTLFLKEQALRFLPLVRPGGLR
jgi:mono/diheme cytochrome c family protein